MPLHAFNNDNDVPVVLFVWVVTFKITSTLTKHSNLKTKEWEFLEFNHDFFFLIQLH